jgi:hypothetical protein
VSLYAGEGLIAAPRTSGVAPEAARRLDLFKPRRIEVAARLQRFRRRALLKAAGQRIEPSLIFGLEFDELGNGVSPSLRAAASVSRSPVSIGRTCC